MRPLARFPPRLTAAAALAQPLPVVELRAGMHLIRAEVAADFATRARGLMHRKSARAERRHAVHFRRARRSNACG